MTETSWRIYQALAEAFPNSMKSITLARMIGLKSSNELRRAEGRAGLIEIAAKEIVAQYKVMVLTDNDGVKLTKDRAEVVRARNRLRAHARSENRHAEVMDECLAMMSTAQLDVFQKVG